MAGKTSDEQLLKRFTAGDSAALGELAGRYERPLLGLASGLLAGRYDATCDAVQETWVRVIRHAARFDGRSSVKTWLYRILVNRCHDLRSRRSTTASNRESEVAETAAPSDITVVEQTEQSDTVRRAVESLNDDRRFVILLCYHADMTHEQAAEILEIPLGTLKSRLHAALAALRRQLTPEHQP